MKKISGHQPEKKLRRLSVSGQARLIREFLLARIEDELYMTVWPKHFARPAQVRAGARKIFDQRRSMALAQRREGSVVRP